MKKFLLVILITLGVHTLLAQAPEAFKYQAVARNADGSVLANKLVNFRISILVESVTGTVVYSEQHLKTTNPFGLVDMEIGKGTSPVGTFASVAWGTGNYFVKVEMDPSGGTSFQHVGTSQLLSVPYALHAKTAQTTAESSSFVNLDGDQAITGGKIFSNDILVNDSITVGSGKNGHVSNTAIGASVLLSNTTGKSNTAVGYKTLQMNTMGLGNTALGNEVMYLNTTGHNNTGLGGIALYANTTGFNNVAVGWRSLRANTTGAANVALGFAAAHYTNNGTIENKTGTQSVFLGAYTKPQDDAQNNQIVIGYQAVGNGSNSVVLGNDLIQTTILKGKVGIGKNDPSVALDVVGQVNVNSNRITNVAKPSSAGDAVNKAYVDSLSARIFSTGSNTTDTLVIGDNVDVFTTGDGLWNRYIKLPVPSISNNYLRVRTGTTLLVRCRSSFQFFLKKENTDMASDLSLETGQSAVFMYDGDRWLNIYVSTAP